MLMPFPRLLWRHSHQVEAVATSASGSSVTTAALAHGLHLGTGKGLVLLTALLLNSFRWPRMTDSSQAARTKACHGAGRGLCNREIGSGQYCVEILHSLLRSAAGMQGACAHAGPG